MPRSDIAEAVDSASLSKTNCSKYSLLLASSPPCLKYKCLPSIHVSTSPTSFTSRQKQTKLLPSPIAHNPLVLSSFYADYISAPTESTASIRCLSPSAPVIPGQSCGRTAKTAPFCAVPYPVLSLTLPNVYPFSLIHCHSTHTSFSLATSH